MEIKVVKYEHDIDVASMSEGEMTVVVVPSSMHVGTLMVKQGNAVVPVSAPADDEDEG